MSSIHIKDLDKKSNIDGTESILIQDSKGTKRLDINTLLNNNNNVNIDLSDYATKNDLNNKADKSHTHTTSDITNLSIPTKTSELTNDSNFLKSIPSEYITESELSSALSTKANKTDLNGYATTSFVNNAIEKIDGTNILTFTSLTDFQNYTPTSSDVGKRVIIIY